MDEKTNKDRYDMDKSYRVCLIANIDSSHERSLDVSAFLPRKLKKEVKTTTESSWFYKLCMVVTLLVNVFIKGAFLSNNVIYTLEWFTIDSKYSCLLWMDLARFSVLCPEICKSVIIK